MAEGRFSVTIASNTPPGDYEVRVMGRFGVSSSRLFSVGDLPVSIENATNGSPESGQAIAMDSVVYGQATSSKSDFFRFDARKAVRLFLECEAEALDSKMEPTLILYSRENQEVARSRRGGFIDFTPPADSSYYVRIHDQLNRGGTEFFYRLTLTSRAHLDFSIPSAALPGSNRVFTIVGRNLPGGKPFPEKSPDGKPLEQIEISLNVPGDPWGQVPLPAGLGLPSQAAGVDGFDWRLATSNRTSNPLFISIASVPAATEQEASSNNQPAQVVEVPVDVSGRFQGAQDLDAYEFQAKKGQVWIIEVLSHRLGSPCDPALFVQRISKDDKGKEAKTDVGENYDAETVIPGKEYRTDTGDAMYRLEVKEDGTYRVIVRDQAHSRESPKARVYRLVIRPPMPDVRLVATPFYVPPANNDSREMKVPGVFLRKDSTIALKVMAFRRDGFDLPIQLTAEGLPGGVTSPVVRMAGDSRTATLLLTAEDLPTNAVARLRIIGKSIGPQGERRHEARVGGMVWGVANHEQERVRSRLGDEFVVGVSAEEVSPLTMEAESASPIDVSPEGKAKIPFLIKQRAEFPNNFKLRLVGHAALGGAGKELDVDKKATNAVFEIDLAQTKLPEGEHWLHVETRASLKVLRSIAAHREAESTKAESEKALTMLKESQDKAKAALPDLSKQIEELEVQVKTLPEKMEALMKAKEAKAAVDGRLAELSKRHEETTQAKTTAENRLKAFASKDFNDLFFSTPVLVRVTTPKAK